MAIPKILHQVWLGPKEMPAQFVSWREQWRRLHPDWEYMLHTDKDIPQELRGYMDGCKGYSSKSNVLRLYVVNKYGGVYADTDFEWNRNIDLFLDYQAFVAKQHGSEYCNAFFGATACHPMIAYQLEQLPEYSNKNPPWGPALMTAAVNKFKNTVTCIPTSHVYPYMWFEPYQPASIFPDSYAVHHWSKSWWGV